MEQNYVTVTLCIITGGVSPPVTAMKPMDKRARMIW